MSERKKIIIKKYPNRRLYNTQTSTYINLEDLAEMVRRDEDFTVIDIKTNENITRITLAQIILDHETKGFALLPDDLIRLVIKFYDHPLNKVLQDYFAQSVKAFNSSLTNGPFLGDAMKFSKNIEEYNKEQLQYWQNLFFGGMQPKKGDSKKKDL